MLEGIYLAFKLPLRQSIDGTGRLFRWDIYWHATGLGPVSAIMMIPVTYGLDPASGLILIAGVYYGAVFGGSTSAILINAPGVSGAVATAFDGYPMAEWKCR